MTEASGKINLKVDALNQVNGLNTHLDDAHIHMDRLKFVLFRIHNHAQMCKKKLALLTHVDSDWTVYNMGNGKSSAGLFSFRGV